MDVSVSGCAWCQQSCSCLAAPKLQAVKREWVHRFTGLNRLPTCNICWVTLPGWQRGELLLGYNYNCRLTGSQIQTQQLHPQSTEHDALYMLHGPVSLRIPPFHAPSAHVLPALLQEVTLEVPLLYCCFPAALHCLYLLLLSLPCVAAALPAPAVAAAVLQQAAALLHHCQLRTFSAAESPWTAAAAVGDAERQAAAGC